MRFDASEPLAVTSRSFSRNAKLRDLLKARYPSVKFNDSGKHLTPDETIEFLKGFKRAIVSLERIDAKTLDALSELRLISKYGVGLDNLDLPAIESRGVWVGWQGGVNRRSVAELALAFMLVCIRGIHQSSGSMVRGEWMPAPGRQLSGKTIGIIGFGYIGQDLTRLLKPFGVQVLANDVRPIAEEARELGADVVSLDDLLKKSDIVSVHVPLEADTRNLMNRERIARMKPGAMLLNTARGGLVDEGAAFDALEEGRLGAAAFDVFEKEPPTDRRLIGHQRFFGTPHIGGSAEEAVIAMGMAAIEGLEKARPAREWIADERARRGKVG